MFRLAFSCVVASGLALAGPAKAIEYMSADVMVSEANAVLSGETFTCAVTVHVNGAGDDSARNVTLVVVLPLEVKVLGGLPPACRAVLITGGTGTWASHVICTWPTIARRTSQSVKVVTTRSRHPRSKSCGGLVWNHVPDPDPANNARSATAP